MRVTVDNSTRRKHLDWINAILDYKGWNQTTLAREAGVDPSTLSRFRREVNPGSKLDSETVERIARLGIIPPYETTPPLQPRGFTEGEAEPFDLDDASMLSRAVAAAKQGHNALDHWTLKSRALELAGYLPGDVLMIDQNAVPEPGDIVLAQLLDNPLKPETVFRVYEPPFLVAVSSDTWLFKPILINGNVHIRGVKRMSFRPQSPRRAA